MFHPLNDKKVQVCIKKLKPILGKKKKKKKKIEFLGL